VVIVGAGVSGLSAAVALTLQGVQPLVLEQRPAAGGRATSFRDATTGETVDNGQHVLIAGYRRTMRFLDAIGASNLVLVQPRLSLLMHHPVRGFRRFSVPRLRAPFHLGAGIMLSGVVSFADRIRMLRAGRALLHTQIDPVADMTVSDWLDSTGQPVDARRSFWEPLSVSVMNELPQLAAARPFLNSLTETFGTSWRDASIVLPKVPLTTLYADKATSLIRSRGGTITFNADVRSLLVSEGRVHGVTLRDDSQVRAAAVILSVPPHRLTEMVAEKDGTGIATNRLRHFQYAPIVSTHLWFPREFMTQDFVGLIGRQTQWVFNRRRIESSAAEESHLSTVTSAAHTLVERSNEDIIRIVIDDLRTAFGSRVEHPRHAVVIREKRATVSLTPSAEKLRPSQKTALPNLFLAGDWTDTGYPATIEGAVKSGELCAAHLLKHFARPGKSD